MKKRFGQHFLTDPNIVKRIVDFSAIGRADTAVEIGPGGGVLTRELARAARKVIAIEIDRELIAPLREKSPENVEIVEADALQFDFNRIAGAPFHVAGNLPYNVATPLLKRFIEFRRIIIAVTIMLQKEVADRITARPDDESYGPLSILVQYYARPTYGFTVRPGAFRPRPKVNSAVIRFDWRPDVPDAQAFTDFVHDVFATRRKKLINNLARMYSGTSREMLEAYLQKANVPENARPENLSIDDFLRLYNQICRH